MHKKGSSEKVDAHGHPTGPVSSEGQLLTSDQQADVAASRAQNFPTRRATVPALEEILFEPLPILDHGFIRVIDYMGDDGAVVQAARELGGAAVIGGHRGAAQELVAAGLVGLLVLGGQAGDGLAGGQDVLAEGRELAVLAVSWDWTRDSSSRTVMSSIVWLAVGSSTSSLTWTISPKPALPLRIRRRSRPARRSWARLALPRVTESVRDWQNGPLGGSAGLGCEGTESWRCIMPRT